MKREVTDEEIRILRAKDECRYAAAYATACYRQLEAAVATHKEACRLRGIARQRLRDLRNNEDSRGMLDQAVESRTSPLLED